jgi:hypothetical protein
MPKEHTYLIPALAGRDGSEYAVQCVFDNPSAVAERSPRLLVTFSWGWLQPNVYYAFSQNGQSHKLKWTFPPETCSYVDGWVTQLYYFNEQLLLITEDAIYVAAYKPFTDPIVSIQEKDWKVVVLLQQAQK